MTPPVLRYDEILFNVVLELAIPPSTDPQARTYDVLVYTVLAPSIPWRSRDLLKGRPAEVGGLPFASTEQITIRWTRYSEYLRLLQEHETNPGVMRERFIETMTGGLQALFALFEKPPPASRPLRIWWSLESPELEDLPWEFMTHGSGTAGMSLVRGAPGDLAPLLPITNGLRLAIVGDAQAASPELVKVLDSPPAGITSRRFSGNLRQLLEVAREGFELVHVIADGWVSLGMDGVLDFGGGETVSRSELAGALYGSRVTILALSPPRVPHTQLEVPHVYRAFAHFAGEELLQSVVATIGPAQPQQEEHFWRTYYQDLVKTLSVEAAMRKSRQEEPAFPAALFLLHRLGAEFSRRPAPASTAPDPARVNAELQTSRHFLEQVQLLDSRYVPVEDRANRNPLLEKERERHESLESSLEPLRRIEREEP